MGLSSEQVAELTTRVNDRLDEWEFPADFVISTHLPRGVVRLVHDEIAAWQEGDADAHALNIAFERGYEEGYAEAKRTAEWAAANREDAPAPDDMSDGELIAAAYGAGFERGKLAGAPTDDTPRLVTISAGDDVSELADAWPEMPDLTDGVDGLRPVKDDHFAEHPVAGESAPEEPPKSDEKLTTALEPHTNGHAPALSPQAAATLGPEHTINTPLDKPIGRARDPLPDPDVARDKLAAAVAQGGNGAVSRLLSPRTLAEVDAELDAQVASVWGDDEEEDGLRPAISPLATVPRGDDDTGTDAPRVAPQPKRVRDFKQERESRGEYKRPVPAKHAAPKRMVQPDRDQLIKELKRQAMGGVAPSQSFFDSAKPATWGTAQAQCRRLGVSWVDLVREAGLKPSPTGAAAHQPQGVLRAG